MSQLFSIPPQTPELYAFWMRSYDFVGNAIACVTDGQWSHAGLLLHTPDGHAVVYEALFREGKIVKQDARLRFQKFLRDNKGSQLCIVPIKADAAQIEQAVKYAESCIKDVSYGRWQLASMLIAQRFGIPVPRSTTKQVCSELLGRSLGSGDDDKGAILIMDLRDPRHESYDETTPDSSFRRMMSIVAGYGDFTNHALLKNSPELVY